MTSLLLEMDLLTVHKNNDGNIMKIEKNFISFRRA